MDKRYGEFIIDEGQFCQRSYGCDPQLCKDGVCCAVFDVAITFEEKARIENIFDKLYEFCPWLKDGESPFQLTPCELFIRKRPDGLCWFNYRDDAGRCWCAIHAAALMAGENPFSWKPLNCSLWPFLRDGENRLEVDMHDDFPCLKLNADNVADEELLKLIEAIAQARTQNE